MPRAAPLCESLSAYARQFLSLMEKPDVDHIEGCRLPSPSSRSPPPTTRARPSAPSPRFTTTCGCCSPGSASHAARPTPFRSRPRPSARWWIRCWPSPKAQADAAGPVVRNRKGSTPSCWRTWRPRVTSAPASTAKCAICRILPRWSCTRSTPSRWWWTLQGAR
jgi:hypothetical protein